MKAKYDATRESDDDAALEVGARDDAGAEKTFTVDFDPHVAAASRRKLVVLTGEPEDESRSALAEMRIRKRFTAPPFGARP
jgi:hypothetical protein